jgi:uncharacterized protein (TIGR02246 family)
MGQQTTITHPSGTHQTSAARHHDDEALRALFASLLDDWARGDGDAYGSRFTDDVDYVAFDGSITRGRHAVAQSHQALFDRWLKGTRLTGTIESIRFLGESGDVALIHATGSTTLAGETTPRRSRDSIQTLVAVKQSGTWRFTAFHNGRVLRRKPWQWAIFAIWEKIVRR